MKFIHVIEYLHKKIVFQSGVYSAFYTDGRKIHWFECGSHTLIWQIGCIVNSLVSVIHSYLNPDSKPNPKPNPNKSMICGLTYLKENNYYSLYPRMLRGAFHDHDNKGVDCE